MRDGRPTELTEPEPAACPNGHPLRHPTMQRLWLGCSCAGGFGHRGWRCWTCGEVIYEPPHLDGTLESAYRPR
jgi:hypothetical protein